MERLSHKKLGGLIFIALVISAVALIKADGPFSISGGYAPPVPGPQGPAGTNATTTAGATQSVAGLMSAADKTKLDGLNAVKVSYGSAAFTGTFILGGTQDVTVPLTPGFANANYQAVAGISSGTLSVLSTLKVAIKSKTTTNCVVTVTASGILTVGAGTVVEVIAISP